MQNVSEAWKSGQEQQLVDETYVELSFDVSDPDAIADATSSDNGAIYFADTGQIVSEVDKNIEPYGTLEENLWLLDGSRRSIPESDYGDNGYIGNVLSKEDGSFDTTPIIDIDFSEVHEPIIPGITITWGIAYNEYAEAFKITAYNGSVVVAERKIDDNPSVKSVIEFDIENYNRIRIEIFRWCLPRHRPRVSEISVGVTKVYGKSDLMSFDHAQEVDPIGATAPVNKLSFAIDNSNNLYDPNNPTGVSKYLMERQKINVKYGLKVHDGSIEYIPAGVFYLSEWDAHQNGMTATFVARDLLEFMQKTYIKGLYMPPGATLYELAMDVLTEANLPLNDDGTSKWVVSDALKNIKTTAPLPLKSLAECLQYIAQAACCIIYCDRLGILHIEPISTIKTDYALTHFNLFSRPEISLQKPLMAVSTKIYNYVGDETGKELFNGSVAVNGTREVVVTYSQSAINVSATVSGGTLVAATYYTHACCLKLNGNGEVSIVITGDVLSSATSEYVINVNTNGEPQTVDNPLITSTSIAELVSEWVKEWLNHRQIVTMGGFRADPRLDAMDIITSENKFGSETVRMTSIKYTYAGAFKGTGEGRVV